MTTGRINQVSLRQFLLHVGEPTSGVSSAQIDRSPSRGDGRRQYGNCILDACVTDVLRVRFENSLHLPANATGSSFVIFRDNFRRGGGNLARTSRSSCIGADQRLRVGVRCWRRPKPPTTMRPL